MRTGKKQHVPYQRSIVYKHAHNNNNNMRHNHSNASIRRNILDVVIATDGLVLNMSFKVTVIVIQLLHEPLLKSRREHKVRPNQKKIGKHFVNTANVWD